MKPRWMRHRRLAAASATVAVSAVVAMSGDGVGTVSQSMLQISEGLAIVPLLVVQDASVESGRCQSRGR